eukprot:2887926-Prymnesium_polylepis.2
MHFRMNTNLLLYSKGSTRDRRGLRWLAPREGPPSQTGAEQRRSTIRITNTPISPRFVTGIAMRSTPLQPW